MTAEHLWIQTFVATIGLLLAEGDHDGATAKAEYLANDAVDKFRAAFPDN